MSLEFVTWKITGKKPLLQSNPVNTMTRKEDAGVATDAKKKTVPKAYDEAKKQLYVDGKHFVHPSIGFWHAMLLAAPHRKIGNVAVSTLLGHAITTTEEFDVLVSPKTWKPLTSKDWVVDTRRTWNKSRGGILVARPKWREWGVLLTLEIETDYVEPMDPVTILLNIAGRYGIGCGRTHKPEGSSAWKTMHLGKFSAELK